jgi:hypothetical protein
MSELLEKLVYEMVGLRRRVGALETLEAPSPAPSLLIGMIVPYSGTMGGADNHHPVNAATGQPDTSWHICNGETVNGHATPDLRDRFVVGAGGSYAAGSKGGAATHTHGYSDVPSHTHTMASGGAHTHSIYYATSGTGNPDKPGSMTRWNTYESLPMTPGGDGAHTHTINATGEASPETDSTSSLPPYVALVWVMKVA